jgi:basic amino acid/polyamine antiporter, APA family
MFRFTRGPGPVQGPPAAEDRSGPSRVMSHSENPDSLPSGRSLQRVVGTAGAVLLGLGSILGSGIFVSIGVAAGVAGSGVLPAVLLAAVVATFNGLSSAQLAAAHPVSGGTYAYGYRYLNPALGFTAGWMFLCAKSASAATAALGLAGYFLAATGASTQTHRCAVGLASVALLTTLVASGMRRSSRFNTLVVTITLLSLFGFVASGLPSAVLAFRSNPTLFASFFEEPHAIRRLLHGTALMFVAYTGYGRIATLGEEVRDPHRTIPRAILLTLVSTAALYGAVVFVAVGAAGVPAVAEATAGAAAPLAVAARGFGSEAAAWLVTAGAFTAMLGVVLNLLLGLSRVVLAMARRGDLPIVFARVDETKSSPTAAVWLVGAIIAGLVSIGSVKTTWSFSAFTVLVYYSLTNLAALCLPREARRFPRWISATGLVCCAGLAFWVEPVVLLVGSGTIAAGLIWHRVARMLVGKDSTGG